MFIKVVYTGKLHERVNVTFYKQTEDRQIRENDQIYLEVHFQKSCKSTGPSVIPR